MIYLILGYIYLCIHRPFEVWEGLGDLRIELLYFILLCGTWLIAPKRPGSIALIVGIVGMYAAFLFSWMLSPWSDKAVEIVKNFTLVVAFACILGTVLRSERDLYRVAAMFLAVMALYMLHSVYEYKLGRHTFRMGIARLIGVDKTLGDPNSFGASIVYALPFVTFFWSYWGSGWKRCALLGYVLLSIGCVLLTGSRSSLLGVGLWCLYLVFRSRHKLAWLIVLGGLGCASFFVLPESLQNRFETIIDPSVGPANAQESGQGRVEGFFTGLKLWSEYPISGCGPGGWRPASGSKIESHNLYGQLVGELGTPGLFAFGFLVAALGLGLRRVTRSCHPLRGPIANPQLFQFARSMQVSVFLLLFLGIFGHNLYRYNWSWYCAFTAVAWGLCRERLGQDPDLHALEADQGWDYSISPAAV